MVVHSSDAYGSSSMNNPITLPSVEEIDRMEHLQQVAFKALEVSDGFVKCQKCGCLQPLHKESERPINNRINLLEQQIKRVESLHSRYKVPDGDYNKTMKELKEELASLLKVEEKNNLLRRLHLYSSRITRFRYVCGSCYDKIYRRRRR